MRDGRAVVGEWWRKEERIMGFQVSWDMLTALSTAEAALTLAPERQLLHH